MGERADRVRGGDPFADVRGSGGFASASGGESDQPPDVAEIASDIEQTRAELTETIDAIQERLVPERLTDQAKDAAIDATEQARDAALEVVDHAVQEAKAAVRELTDQAKAAVRDATVGRVERMASSTTEAVERMASSTTQTAKGWRSTVGQTIQQNPIPATLVGLGLGWMLLNRPSTSSGGQTGYTYRPESRTGYTGYSGQSQASGVGGQVQQSAGQIVDQVQGSAGQVAGQVQETAGQVVEQVQQTAGQVVDQVQETAGQARGRLEQLLHNNPMQVGAATLLLGGVLGLVTPPTQREQQLMGPARDRLVHQVQEAAQGTMQKVQRVAEEAGEAAEKEVRYQGLTKEG